MVLTPERTRELLDRFGIFAVEACDGCSLILGAVRYTRQGEPGVWCSKECRGDGERPAIRKGGRPRKYRTEQECRAAKTSLQRVYRDVAVWKKPPCSPQETQDLQTQN